LKVSSNIGEIKYKT